MDQNLFSFAPAMGEKLLLLAPLVLLACVQLGSAQRYYKYYPRSYYGKNLYEHGQSISDTLVQCGPHTCGVGAHCIHGIVRPVCACLAGYSGDPLSQCVKIECLENSECRSHQVCVNQHCVNPCEGTCGINANCDVRNHIPVCSCPAGYTGNPFSSCRVADPEEACHPSPCGSNTKCHVANNQAICTCLPGYRGSPLTGCHHECESDGECSASQSCRDFRCTSPCSDCGVNADCETVAAHRAVCKCPRGYFGDPYRICTPECSSDGECPSYKPACVYNACVDPCINACGVNADCNLRGLTPVCSCPRNMTGDPFTYCRPFEARDLCEPNPCGANAKCTPGHDRTGAERPVCTCPSGYIGNALVACDKGECELDSQCADHLACVGYQCVDPCLGNTQCGSGAVCMARRHLAVCTCPSGHNGDALVNCYESRSVAASGQSYYRYKRNGDYDKTESPAADSESEKTSEAKEDSKSQPEVPAVTADETKKE
ncbi:neurogenic locus notch homolog protein 1-like isoform X2 [Plodia interpunctella]|uniref:neurogenic locus notch homolog protein 1-like isoform X2 n=1 Tax=Plodia interpunctella TaxID=58824 RepID=UPI002367A119|nr:neurogenic locus notch homolog protein 1-like isoform X2 [Plodia interpunctella]